MTEKIGIRRAYEAPAPNAGYRVLVDRLWPRGVSKASLQLDEWARDVAPSDELRKWFAHDPSRWDEFRQRYRDELADRPDAVAPLVERARCGPLTLVFGARDPARNNAVVLRELICEALASTSRS